MRPVIAMPVLHLSSFVRQDIETLEQRYEVRRLAVRPLGSLLRGLVEVWRADLLFCWFGSIRFLPHALVAKVRRRPVVIIAGGYDLASEPAIGYGNMRSGWTRRLGRLLFRLADRVVCYSEFGRSEAVAHAGLARDQVDMIPLGFDADAVAPNSACRKRPMVLTVGVIDQSTIRRKGILTVARLSRLIPEIPVVFAGKAEASALAELQAEAGPNARFAGFVSDDDLHQLFSEAQVYVQPSIHEAFGCSVAEAMLYRCIPVVSDRGSLPEVVGQAGLFVPAEDPPALAAAVLQALSGTVPLPEQPRERISERYPLALRRTRLYALLDGLLSRS